MAAEFHELKVAGIVQETADTRSYLFDVPAALRATFAYEAGQFLTFELPMQIAGQAMKIRRCYSLASAPEVDAWPKVTVKRVKEGRASNWLNDRIRIGSPLQVQAPEGRFVLSRTEKERPLCLFGGGSGITPVISLLKSALTTTRRPVKLVYANRDHASIIFEAELAMWLRRFPERLTVHHHLDANGGFLTVPGVSALISGWEKAEFYVCGPTPFMDTVEASLEGAGVDRHARSFERFVSPLDPDRRGPAEPEPANAGDVPASYTLVMDGQKHDVPYEKGETLLQAASRAGLKVPSSCEEGYCSCCMAFLRSGKVHMAQHEALSAADIAKSWVLPCQAKAAGAEPITIDMDEKY